MKKLLTPLVSTFVLVACGQSVNTPQMSSSAESSSTTASTNTTSSATGTATTSTATGTSTTTTSNSGASGSGGSGSSSAAQTSSSTSPTSSGGSGSSSAASTQTSNGSDSASATSTSGTDSAGSSGSSTDVEASICPYTLPELPETFPDGWSSGDITVFNDNGGWTWYNDERVVVDAEAGKIIVSSAASSASNQSANPNIDAVIHDLATGMNTKMKLGSLSYSDDHNNGGILVKAPNSYFVGWAHHNKECISYWRNYDNGAWDTNITTYDWKAKGHNCPWGPNSANVTYNNPWNMSAEGVYYNFIRSIDTSPNLLISEDQGKTWNYGGRLTATPQMGYNSGYYKYWGNGVDRVDFFATENHPRDFDTSVFHGYVKGGKSYDSFDKEIDDNIFDGDAPEITQFTKVFAAHGSLNGVELNALWNFDIARYDDGTIGVLWQGRVGARGKDNTNPNHRIAYSRFDGTKWTATYLVRGGRTLYRNMSDWWEEDYLGGAALDPDDPHVIYVSSPIDPRDDMTTYPNHEIWKGVTCDDGATFQWTPVTMNSPHENLRPVVPKWDKNNTAVLWFRGNYQTAQMYDAEVVGIITREE